MSLNKTDTSNVIALIDACCIRGAFRGNELGQIAELRSRFEALQSEIQAEIRDVVKPEQEETKS